MKLYKFINDLQNKVQEFQEWWELKHDETPTLFPLTMNEAEWYEQFIIWEEQSDDA